MSWLVAAVVLLGGLAGCSVPKPELAPLPDVDLDSLGPNLSEQLRPTLRALESRPGDAAVAGKAGMLLQAYGQHGLAAAYLARARGAAPADLRWEYYLGISLERLGRPAEAAESFRRCAEIDKTFLPARRRLAAALLESNEVEAGLSYYRSLATEAPRDARIWYGLGRAEAAAGNTESAVDHLLKAVANSPRYGAAHYALAQAYSQLGMPAEAERHLEHYERERHGEPASDDRLLAAITALRISAAEYLKQGVEAREEGRSDAAIDLHLRALEEDPGLVQARVNLVILYGSAGQADEAEEQYRLGVAGGEATAELHYNFGVLAYETGRPGEAAEAFAETLALNPAHALANHNLGQLLEEEGRVDEAMSHYQRAVANRPDHGLSHYKIGMLLMRQRRASEAVRAFRRAARERSDRTPTYLFSLAAALLASSDRTGATASFRDARVEAETHGQVALVERIDRALRTMGAESGAPD
ncbi:MAG: tetratricopeptide repeat protein [Bryobacterales bacterium]|nr:tetratricopeptide repeat protein [Bryobacterales bacterium]